MHEVPRRQQVLGAQAPPANAAAVAARLAALDADALIKSERGPNRPRLLFYGRRHTPQSVPEKAPKTRSRKPKRFLRRLDLRLLTFVYTSPKINPRRCTIFDAGLSPRLHKTQDTRREKARSVHLVLTLAATTMAHDNSSSEIRRCARRGPKRKAQASATTAHR